MKLELILKFFVSRRRKKQQVRGRTQIAKKKTLTFREVYSVDQWIFIEVTEEFPVFISQSKTCNVMGETWTRYATMGPQCYFYKNRGLGIASQLQSRICAAPKGILV